MADEVKADVKLSSPVVIAAQMVFVELGGRVLRINRSTDEVHYLRSVSGGLYWEKVQNSKPE